MLPADPDELRRFLRQQFQAIEEATAALAVAGDPSPATEPVTIQGGTIMAREGDTIRVEPPTGGITVLLPTARSANKGQDITVILVGEDGPVTVKAVKSLTQNVASVELTGLGMRVFRSDGGDGMTAGVWWIVGQSSETPPGPEADAQFVVGAADPLLPNAAVGTDSTEIDFSFTPGGVATWVLNAASVAFSKLADLTGLSVLGRASNSAGVMAAITATGARQALMSNSAGTAIGWRALETADLPAVPVPTWAQVLTSGAATGANDPIIDNARFLRFGTGGALPPGSTANIRSGTDLIHAETNGGGITLQTRTTGAITLRADGIGGTVAVTTLGTTTFTNGGSPALRLNANQSWTVGGSTGTAGQYLRSGGAGGSPTWATIGISEFGTIPANTILGNANNITDVVTARAVAADSVLARVGGNLVSHPWATLAGGGLTYAAGVMAVGAGTRITVNANDVQLAAGAAESFLGNFTAGSAVADYRAGSSVAGAGLTYTAGGTLAVGAGTGITVNANDVALTNPPVGTTGAVTIAAGGGASTFSGIRDNGALQTARTFINFISSLHLNSTVVGDPGNDEMEVTYTLDLTDAYTWTGDHTWSGSNAFTVSTTGDVSIAAAIVGIDSDTSMLLHADNDLTLESDADVRINCDALRIASAAGPNVAGFIILDGVSASTPALVADEGMFWVSDPGVSATMPSFTDDGNVDMFLQPAGPATVISVSGTQNNAPVTNKTKVIRCTAATTLNGVAAGYEGQCVDVVADGNFDVTVTHNSTSATGAVIVLPSVAGASLAADSTYSARRGGARIVYVGSAWRGSPAPRYNAT